MENTTKKFVAKFKAYGASEWINYADTLEVDFTDPNLHEIIQAGREMVQSIPSSNAYNFAHIAFYYTGGRFINQSEEELEDGDAIIGQAEEINDYIETATIRIYDTGFAFVGYSEFENAQVYCDEISWQQYEEVRQELLKLNQNN